MNADLKKKADSLFYFLTKDAARDSFSEFLESCGLSDDDYEQIKKEVLLPHGIKTYL